MNNLHFFSICMNAELHATLNIIESVPATALDYTPHPVSRTACEIIEHIVAHVYDLERILRQHTCDEQLAYPFASPAEAAADMKQVWTSILSQLEHYSSDDWENKEVELLVKGKHLVTSARNTMMWFFFFDIIHHRGQLSAYIRPMGGKNPAVYGYSADTLQTM